MNNKNNFTDKEWEELSAILSDEKDDNESLLNRFLANDGQKTTKYWKELREMNTEKEINVDKAWNKLYSRLDENALITKAAQVRRIPDRNSWLKIAAVALILLSIASGLIYLNDRGIITRKSVVATSENQKNLDITLPDGSSVILNRNTVLSYTRKNFVKNNRNVTLSGEAFFEIMPDETKPFIVDAGTAKIRVVGTSFNVITKNLESSVEVYVETGKVLLSDDSGKKKLEIDPGFIGTINDLAADKKVNNNPNYMAWNTGLLVYDGQTLDVVFSDLKKVYGMDIVTDDQAILDEKWSAPIINQPGEKIIRLICLTFNLNYIKDGNVYHLSEK